MTASGRRGLGFRLGAGLAVASIALVGQVLGAFAASGDSTVCNGALLPVGYGLTSNLQPYALHAPYADPTLFNPTSVAHFVINAYGDLRNTAPQRSCLALIGGDALLAGGVTRPVPGSAPVVTALWFPYPFTFSAQPNYPALQPGWISGIAQGSALSALAMLSDDTKDPRWDAAGEEVLASFLVPFSAGGFVTTDHGRTWFQEYPTSPPTYVLNGHMEATLSLARWYVHTGDPLAWDLFQTGIAATVAALPMQVVRLPQGLASAYDATRRWVNVPLRAASGSPLKILSASLAATAASPSIPVTLPVGPAVVAYPNLVQDPGMSTWEGGIPTGWRKFGATAPSAVQQDTADGAVLLVTPGGHTTGIFQDIPASKLVPGNWYRVSWRARTGYPADGPATSGKVWATALCPGGPVDLGAYPAVRGPSWAQYDLLVRMPPTAGCNLRVQLAQDNTSLAGTSLYFDDVAVTKPQSAQGAMPAFPVSAFDNTPAQLIVTYTGKGEIQAWRNGRWWMVSALPATVAPRTITVTIPPLFTGPDIQLGYHESHVLELIGLYRLSGNSTILAYARLWAPLSPKYSWMLAGLTASPLQPPASAGPSPSST